MHQSFEIINLNSRNQHREELFRSMYVRTTYDTLHIFNVDYPHQHQADKTHL